METNPNLKQDRIACALGCESVTTGTSTREKEDEASS
jgi:hypothetical protein